MIYTCTLNPSVDYKMVVDQFKQGSLNRALSSQFYPGGKGINVSRVLRNLGTPNIAIGFLGGFTGRYIQDQLNKEGLVNDFIFHEDPTRINIKLKSNTEETEINGTGAVISEEIQELLLKKIRLLTSNDYLVLAGSLPTMVSFTFYERIAAICHNQNVSLIIDTSGPKLKDLLKYSPFLIKPNRFELNEILEKEMTSENDLIEGGKSLLELGAKNIIISMGAEGAIFMNQHLILKANAPKGEVKSTIGSGDSMVAGFLSAYLMTKDTTASFRLSTAAGSATAFSNDLCTKESVHSLLSEIEIKEIYKEEKR